MTATSTAPPPLRTEILAGVTTFLTMSYIVVVNPAILSTEGTGMPMSGVLTATVLICVGCTLLMGLYARLPYAVAPGMGINAFFTYSLVLGRGVPWQVALGLVFWAGVLFLVSTPSITGQTIIIDGGESLVKRPRDVALDPKLARPPDAS